MQTSNVVTIQNKRPLFRSERYPPELAHLDLAALWLNDRGWRAEAGAYRNRNGDEVAGLVTNAPKEEAEASFGVAFSSYCALLREEYGFDEGELPDGCRFRPSPTTEISLDHDGGQAFCYCQSLMFD